MKAKSGKARCARCACCVMHHMCTLQFGALCCCAPPLLRCCALLRCPALCHTAAHAHAPTHLLQPGEPRAPRCPPARPQGRSAAHCATPTQAATTSSTATARPAGGRGCRGAGRPTCTACARWLPCCALALLAWEPLPNFLSLPLPPLLPLTLLQLQLPHHRPQDRPLLHL